MLPLSSASSFGPSGLAAVSNGKEEAGGESPFEAPSASEALPASVKRAGSAGPSS